MDVLATGLNQYITKESLPLEVQRVIVSRDHFGGESSPVYTKTIRLMQEIAEEIRGESLTETVAIDQFALRVKKGIKVLYKTDHEFQIQADKVYNRNFGNFLDGNEDIILADVGFRGTMQFILASLYEEKNSPHSAEIILYWARPKKEKYGFRDLIPTISNKPSSFNRHNHDLERRLLFESEEGDRAIIKVETEEDLSWLFESLLRLRAGQSTAVFANSNSVRR